MRLSIRARLTLYYCSIVVLVLLTDGVVGAMLQFELTMRHLDDDLARSMATLQGVMRTEFAEGLSLEASADEASIEGRPGPDDAAHGERTARFYACGAWGWIDAIGRL